MTVKRCLVGLFAAVCLLCVGGLALARPPQGPVPHRIIINDGTSIYWCDQVSRSCLPHVERSP